MRRTQIFSCEQKELVYEIVFETNRQFHFSHCFIKFGEGAKKLLTTLVKMMEIVSSEQCESSLPGDEMKKAPIDRMEVEFLQLTENTLGLKIKGIEFTQFLPVLAELIKLEAIPFSLIDKIVKYFDFSLCLDALVAPEQPLIIKHTIISSFLQRIPMNIRFSFITCNLEAKNKLEIEVSKDLREAKHQLFSPKDIFDAIPFDFSENETIIIFSEDEKSESEVNNFRLAIHLLYKSRYLCDSIESALLKQINELYPRVKPLGQVIRQSFFNSQETLYFLPSVALDRGQWKPL